jgi:hypothetical protein
MQVGRRPNWVKRVSASMSVTGQLRPWDLPKHRITANRRDVPTADICGTSLTTAVEPLAIIEPG